tara:strand:- start:637 stop:1317 length:681 start_codon:yes stop_codon:yes gene_type:complete
MDVFHYSFLGLSVFLFILSIILIIYLNNLTKKIKSGDGMNIIQFPAETDKRITDLIENLKNFAGFIDQSVNQDIKKTFNELNDRLKTFESVANDGQKELKQYKEGLHINIQKSLLLSIIETIEFIDGQLKQNNNSNSDLQIIKDKLDIILTNNSIERFSPEIGKNILELNNCEPASQTDQTNEENKVNTISRILSPGYLYQAHDSKKIFLKKSIVVVFSKPDRSTS